MNPGDLEYDTLPPREMDAKEILIRERDKLLAQVTALTQVLAGIDRAIEIISSDT